MKETQQKSDTRRPDCVTQVRSKNGIVTVSGFFNRNTKSTALDKIAKLLLAEASVQEDAAV